MVATIETVIRGYQRRTRFDIVEEHFEEADFICAQRGLLLQSWDNDLAALAQWDERLLAHLDGLLTAETDSYKLVLPKLVAAEAGEAFAAAYTVLASPDTEWVELLARMYFDAAQGPLLAGLCDALKLTSSDDSVRVVLAPWWGNTREALHAAALDVLSFRRDERVMARLDAAYADPQPAVHAAACTAAGRMRARDSLGAVQRLLDAPEPEVRAAALRAGLLLGSNRTLQHCRAAIAQRAAEADVALRILGMVGEAGDLALTLSVLDEPALTAAAIDALGWFGDVGAMNPLLLQLAQPERAVAAARSIRRLTGVDFAAEHLLVTELAAGEETDVTEFAPQPDAARVRSWWSAQQQRYAAGGRYLAGRPHSVPTLCAALKSAALAERDGLACMLALQDAAAPLLETATWATVQLSQMEHYCDSRANKE